MLTQIRHLPNRAADMMEWIAVVLGVVAIAYLGYRAMGNSINGWLSGLTGLLGG
jgi:hypothetical protein